MEIKCPDCQNSFQGKFINEQAANVFVCPYCSAFIVVSPNKEIYRTVPVIPDLTREIPPIEYERLLTPFDYELASLAKVKL